jgi:hypothetical protein
MCRTDTIIQYLTLTIKDEGLHSSSSELLLCTLTQILGSFPFADSIHSSNDF